MHVTTEKAKQVAADINAAGGKAIAVPGNVMDPEFAERLVEETVKYVHLLFTPR